MNNKKKKIFFSMKLCYFIISFEDDRGKRKIEIVKEIQRNHFFFLQ